MRLSNVSALDYIQSGGMFQQIQKGSTEYGTCCVCLCQCLMLCGVTQVAETRLKHVNNRTGRGRCGNAVLFPLEIPSSVSGGTLQARVKLHDSHAQVKLAKSI